MYKYLGKTICGKMRYLIQSNIALNCHHRLEVAKKFTAKYENDLLVNILNIIISIVLTQVFGVCGWVCGSVCLCVCVWWCVLCV